MPGWATTPNRAMRKAETMTSTNNAADSSAAEKSKATAEQLRQAVKDAQRANDDPMPPEPVKPWQKVTTADVIGAVDGTLLADMVLVLQSVTDSASPLPLEFTLPKALALAGCALSQPVDAYNPEMPSRRGKQLARVLIQTSGGQMCNIYACIVADSGTGKDIGGLPVEIANEAGVHLGSTGSGEGLADAMAKNGGGLLTISELQNYLTQGRWEHEACPVLTTMFNAGQVKWSLSKRRGEPRDIPFCAPSILANVQPSVLASIEDGLLMTAGLLPRFLFSRVPPDSPRMYWRPTTEKVDRKPLMDAFNSYRSIHATVTFPRRYLDDVMQEFVRHDAAIPSHYGRLVNEYGPRFAVMLAANPATPDRVEITEDHLERAAVLIRWFYGMAESVLLHVGEPAYVQRMETRMARMLAFIRKHKDCVSKGEFSRQFCHGSRAEQRDKDIRELEARGLISVAKTARGFILKAVE